ncbi:uncharacterized protein SCODWIG_03547 [Saccharomycodes ludwigii]|uniref:C2H2-type domain-containing protein n=1 Tax=Saccharomycodes ludwigii TaxID=36035 RepID=A0A376BAV9_9ASCO|nr:uncharacterized protein SCODWIG_03547 [Saccharomycodes ludwigii]
MFARMNKEINTGSVAAVSNTCSNSTSNTTNNNNMRAKINQTSSILPNNLKLNGTTPSGKPRLFVCSVCSKAFARQEHLSRHERCHTKEKPYICGLCNKCFTRRDLLVRHAHKLHAGDIGDAVFLTAENKRIKLRKGKASMGIDNTTVTTKKYKRRASFSAQTADNYTGRKRKLQQFQTAIPENQDSGDTWNSTFTTNNTTKRENSNSNSTSDIISTVKFSTPQLLPIDLVTADNTLNMFLSLENLADIGPYDNANNSGSTAAVSIPTHGINNTKKMGTINLNKKYDTGLEFFGFSEKKNWFVEVNNNKLSSRDANNIASGSGDSGTIDTNYNTNTNNKTWNIDPLTNKLEVKSLFGNNNNDINNKTEDDNNNNNNNNNVDSRICTKDIGNKINRKNKRNNNNNNDNKPDLGSMNLIKENLYSAAELNTRNTNHIFIPPSDISSSDSSNNLQSTSTTVAANNAISSVPLLTSPSLSDELIFGNFILPSTISSEINNSTSNESILDHKNNNDEKRNKNDQFTSSTSSFDSIGYNFYDLGENFNKINAINTLTNPNLCGIDDSNTNTNVQVPIMIQFFNERFRDMVNQALNYYANLTKNNHNKEINQHGEYRYDLEIPSSYDLNLHLSYFIKHFIPHYPFIHQSIFHSTLDQFIEYCHDYEEGEHNYYEDDIDLAFSNITCLPLFAATFGSFYNKKSSGNTTKNLYEISRRVLHVYLETKKRVKVNNSNRNSGKLKRKNLWLVQALSLNILLGLFNTSLTSKSPKGTANNNIVLKQTAAVCSILRSNWRLKHNSTKNSANYILMESAIRNTFFLFEICSFLKVFYNFDVPTTFLTIADINNVPIPDPEICWNSANINSNIKHLAQFTNEKPIFNTFYQDLVVGKSSPIPESLIPTLLLCDFLNDKLHPTYTPFFLTKLDIKTLQLNLSSDANPILFNDGLKWRNSFMSVKFYNTIEPGFGKYIWKNDEIGNLFQDFYLNYNVLLDHGDVISDFLSALNFSIKNINQVFCPSFDDYPDSMLVSSSSNSSPHLSPLDRRNFSLFNLQGYFYDFLTIIQFLMNFEETPNFKLVCIFKDLSVLCEKALIPILSRYYPAQFQEFIGRPTKINLGAEEQQNIELTEVAPIKVNVLEKNINNILVYSFNDSHFLELSNFSQPNVFNFNKNNEASASNEAPSMLTGDNRGAELQGFRSRYHLSEKYIRVARLFFQYCLDNHSNCYLIHTFCEDFEILENSQKLRN